ncbi:MAG: hypothetical protein WKG07_27255 [Hymenobacter sp.]
MRHYEASVTDEPQRQLQTTLAQLGELATGGDAEGRALRPTLYDLLAQRAIAGLQNQELYVTKPEQQWQPTNPKLFGSAQEFAALKLTAPADDSLNGQLLALQLVQRLTAARLAADNPAALADVDLQRLNYLRGLTQNTDLADQYEPALARLAEVYQALPFSTEFIASQAQTRRDAGDNVTAVALTRAAEARFPKSRGAARARQLRAEIERPELAFTAADVVVPGQPWRLDLTARNVTELHAWAYRITLTEWRNADQYDHRNRPFWPSATPAPCGPRRPPPGPLAVPAHPARLQGASWRPPGRRCRPATTWSLVSNKARLSLDGAAGTVTAHAVLGASQLSAVRRDQPGYRRYARCCCWTASAARRWPACATRPRSRAYNRTKQRDEPAPGGRADHERQRARSKSLARTKPPIALGREQLRSVRSWRGKDTLLTTLSNYYNSDAAMTPMSSRSGARFCSPTVPFTGRGRRCISRES